MVVETPPSADDGDDSSQRFKVGDRVFGSGQGAYAEYIACSGRMLLPVPERWSFAEAAGLFVTAPTSYAALVVRADIQEGKKKKKKEEWSKQQEENPD